MQNAQAVFLDFQELLINVEDLRGTRAGLQDQPFFRVPEHLVEVALLHHAAHDTGQGKSGQVELATAQVAHLEKPTPSTTCHRGPFDFP